MASRFIIGITGRSGSGKTTLVNNLLQHFGADHISLHTMDNYYKPRDLQLRDPQNYLNFDLPNSFRREDFIRDLRTLQSGEEIHIPQYNFNNSERSTYLCVPSRDIILVEGLFVFHYPEIRETLDYKAMVKVNFDEAFRRRLIRDQRERNYSKEEITYRYQNHVEPSFQKYILPYESIMDLIIDNHTDLTAGMQQLIEIIEQELSLRQIGK